MITFIYSIITTREENDDDKVFETETFYFNKLCVKGQQQQKRKKL